MARNFELRVERLEDETVLSVLGELDVATAPHFRRAVGGLLGGEGRRLLVDLGETDFVDSSGLGALVWALFRMRAAGGDMVAVTDDPVIVQTIHMSRLDDLIPLAPSRDDAHARFQAADVRVSRMASGSRAARSAV